jgi:FMN reductase
MVILSSLHHPNEAVMTDTLIATTTSRLEPDPRPVVVGFGGSPREDSTGERLLRYALEAAEAAGARTLLIPGHQLDFPLYSPGRPCDAASLSFVTALQRADGVIIASPAYHGVISGMVKNALDYVEELRDDERPYLDGRAVGCIACATGTQAGATTLMSLRMIVHALRGWPTPLGVSVNSAVPLFLADGQLRDGKVAEQLSVLGAQVVDFAFRAAAVKQAWK